MQRTRRPAASRSARTALLAPLLLAAAAALAPPRSGAVEGTADPRGSEPAPVLSPIETSVSSLHEAVERIEGCIGGCAGVVYLWSRRMPLSLRGVEEVRRAAAALDVELTLLESETAHVDAEIATSWGAERLAIADALLGSGALAHAPALVVHVDGRISGPAILGYKRTEVYEAMVGRRLDAGPGAPPSTRSRRSSPDAATATPGPTAPARPRPSAPRPVSAKAAEGRRATDYEAVGTPGAYFRWVPEHASLAYESGSRVWLLDLVDGESRLGPGFIDFVPTPDGRLFVTPGPDGVGLELYVAEEVLEAARRGRARDLGPLFTDPLMRDQYPSVGILETDGSRTVYRVLTSWFEGVVYRDYVVEHAPSGRPRVRPRSEATVPCPGVSLSIPILSPDGLEVAARDETSGTTKIFRIAPRGRCRAVADVGIHTTKVAWHHTGRVLAFARPRLRAARAAPDRATVGIFLYDRDGPARVTRVRGSEGASALAFPDFVGDDALVFLVPGIGDGTPNTFRVVEDIR